MPAAIIGGTGIDQITGLDLQPQTMVTPYGDVELCAGSDLIFLNRHGRGHHIPPHKINARAHIDALHRLGVKRVFLLYAVGLINQNLKLGTPVLVTDFIDLARRTEHTFFDLLNQNPEQGMGHVDMSVPFCPALMQAVHKSALPIQNGVYACTQGPRLESPAEIRALATLGADIVGMTLSPEVPLARERGMSVCALALPINWAAGIIGEMTIQAAGFKAAQDQLVNTVINVAQATQDEDCAPAKMF